MQKISGRVCGQGNRPYPGSGVAVPTETGQVQFYILPTSILDCRLGNQKSIALSRLEELGAKVVDYHQIHDTIQEVET